MTYVPCRRDTFLIASGPSGKHLFILLNDQPGGPHILVSVTSWKPNGKANDATCRISAGEHPRINRASYIYYRSPLAYATAALQRRVDSGYFEPKEPVADALLRRICAGLSVSQQTPRWAKALWSQLPPVP
jgi:hypothetical protein